MSTATPPSLAPPGHPRRTAAAFLGVFLIALAGFVAFFHHHPLLYDTDAYYHLAVAHTIAREGIPDQLPQVRFSLIGDGFGDKELLFHLLLAPFTLLPGDAATPAAERVQAGGRLALALLDALILALLGLAACKAVGPWGWALPFGLLVAAPEMTWRLVRLRPELLALLLFLLAAEAASRSRFRTLGLLAALFTLAYTAFHALLGLCGLWFGWQVWLARRDGVRAWPWGLLLYPTLGAGLALLLHPNFPANLQVWLTQNVHFFTRGAELDLGTEIRPQTTVAFFALTAGWLLGLVCLWRSAKATTTPATDPETRRRAELWTVAALVFGLLYVQMSRFVIYFVPFTTLALLYQLRRQGRQPDRTLALPGGPRIPTAVALGLCLLLALPQAWGQLRTFASRTAPDPQRLADRADLARALPAGAHVAAPWDLTPIYLLWAPQGRYLNVLDPVFMAVPFPTVYQAQRGIFDGSEPDPPWLAASALDSEFLAFSTATAEPRLMARLAGDPRVRQVYRHFHALYQFLPGANAAFVLDWQVLPPNAALPPPPERPLDPQRSYPRSAAGNLEGYVDLRRLGEPRGCVALAHDLQLSAPAAITYELAPYGPTVLWLDQRQVVSVPAELAAVLGRGVQLPLELGAGRHRLTVLTCPAAAGSHAGFYLLERHRQAITVP